MPKQKKTNAARILDEKKIEYTLIEYAVDEEHLDAVHVAKEVGLPPEQVFKTLVVRGDKTGPVFAVIPGNGELDLKALAKASGNKRAEMVHLKEVLPLTGYIRLALKRITRFTLTKPAFCGIKLPSAQGCAVCRFF